MKKLIVVGLMGLFIGGGLLYLLNHYNADKQQVLSTNAETSITIVPTFAKKDYEPVSPTLETIFSQDHEWTATLPAENITTLVVTGDVMLGRSVNTRNLKYGFTWPFEKIKDLLSSADITFINLESPIVEGCKPTEEGMYFCADPRSIEGLTFADIDVATFANNHATNYGEKGIQDTVKLLTDSNIKVTGVNGKPTVIEKNGRKIAFLGYNDIGHYEGIQNADDARLIEDIKQAYSSADIVVVEFHWGNEYQYEPTERQKELAHQAIDSGADLVVGNHPHWFQGLKLYKGKLIAYSHGNLVFDQMWSEETKTGIVGKYTFYDNQLIDAEFIPVYIENYGQPRIVEAESKSSILKKLKEISYK
jgi:poly-gamma-glutamate synthesis protein (capsule biosynthesis protein)